MTAKFFDVWLAMLLEHVNLYNFLKVNFKSFNFFLLAIVVLCVFENASNSANKCSTVDKNVPFPENKCIFAHICEYVLASSHLSGKLKNFTVANVSGI